MRNRRDIMTLSKPCRKIIPISQYDIVGMETWLENMAKKGFFLYDLGYFFARFTKDEPKFARYRVEPAGEDAEYPSLMLTDLCKENGWCFVSPYKKLFHVFVTDDYNAPELHTDPVMQSATLKKLHRQMLIFSIIYMAIIALFIYQLIHMLSNGSWVQNLLLDSNATRLLLIALYPLSGIYFILSTISIAKLRRHLRAGQPSGHLKNRRSVILKILAIAMICTSVLIFLNTLADNNFYNFQPLSDAPNDMPIISLADIDSTQYTDYTGGYYISTHSLLVPKQYTVSQNVRSDDSAYSETVLHTEYYKAVLPGLAESIYKEKIKENFKRYNITTTEYEMSAYETLATPLFDEAVYALIKNSQYSTNLDESAQYIIAYRDKTVISVRYVGDEYLPDYLELIADTFL